MSENTDTKLATIPRGQTILESTPLVGQTTVAQVVELAKVMAASGLFPDAKTAQAAAGLMMLGQQFGLTPVQSLTALHVIKGKPDLHYSAVLAKIRIHPDYDYKITEHTAKVCSLEIYRHGQLAGVSTFTADDARIAGTQNMDKFPRNMLLARATSNAVKWICPDVVNGIPVYTEGEFGEMHTQADTDTSITDKIRAALKPAEAAPDPYAEEADFSDVDADADGVLIPDDMP